MQVSNRDIQRAARSLIEEHGKNATAKARERVEQMRQRGDTDGRAIGCGSSSRSARSVRRRKIRGISALDRCPTLPHPRLEESRIVILHAVDPAG